MPRFAASAQLEVPEKQKEEEAAVVVSKPVPNQQSKESDVKIRVNHKGTAIESGEGDDVFAVEARFQADADVFIDDETSLGDSIDAACLEQPEDSGQADR